MEVTESVGRVVVREGEAGMKAAWPEAKPAVLGMGRPVVQAGWLVLELRRPLAEMMARTLA